MYKGINIKLIVQIIGSLIILESVFILSTCIVSLIYNEEDWIYFFGTALSAATLGSFLLLAGKNADKNMGKREGAIIVSFTWIIFSFIGLMPFWLSNNIPSFTDAFFETISGFTTTGASILNNIEDLSYSMLFWRSLTHWIGGMGIIVISLALLPMFSYSNMNLFGQETTGPTKDKLHAKVSDTARRLWLIYISLTIAEILLLRLGNMAWFDAICNSFGTIATGGFSTKQASIAYWPSPYIQYIVILFMILSGVNFSLYYFAVKRKFEKIIHNDELRWFLITVFGMSIIVMLTLINWEVVNSFYTFEKAFRDALFQVSSCMTTTGFVTADYMLWKPVTWVIIIMVMLVGSSAGSTCGAIKMVRIVIVFKYMYAEFKRLIHPNAIIPITYSKEIIKNDVVNRVIAFVLLYLFIVVFGFVVLSISGMGFLESIGAMVTCQGGVGPGLGMVGPAFSFSEIPAFSKWFLSFIMLVGRLELYTILLLFTPVFWKK
jgi:trk system potassium uptake protein TrkH